jgi:hypothetical protein
MPLGENVENLIRKNLQYIRNGRRARPFVIGCFTQVQLAAMNAERAGRNFPPMKEQVMFIGGHVYESRIEEDGYSVDDVIAQIASGMHETCVFRVGPKMNSLISCTPRDDGYGNHVLDEAVFECTTKYPRAELLSVIPKGDKKKPRR